jgi:hypothetical protein
MSTRARRTLLAERGRARRTHEAGARPPEGGPRSAQWRDGARAGVILYVYPILFIIHISTHAHAATHTPDRTQGAPSHAANLRGARRGDDNQRRAAGAGQLAAARGLREAPARCERARGAPENQGVRWGARGASAAAQLGGRRAARAPLPCCRRRPPGLARHPQAKILEEKLDKVQEEVPTRIYNVSGSCAGAGSGDFHYYRQARAPPWRGGLH